MIDLDKHEKAIAASLLEKEEVMAFIQKFFAPDMDAAKTALGIQAERKIMELDDNEYGRLMKVLYVSGQIFKERMEELKRMKISTGTPTPRKVPR